MKRQLIVIGAMLGLIVGAPAQADIYRWKDAKGVIHFSNEPPPQGVSVIEKIEEAPYDAEADRRRAEEEMSKARKFAVEGFAENLLPVCDSLEAAIALQHSDKPATPEQMLEGVHATLRQLNAALERNKVMPINPPVGTKFDPHQHQAISMVPAEAEANTVVSVLQKGYLIADRVLRPALVMVAAPK